MQWIQTYAPDEEFLSDRRCRGKVKSVSKSRTYEYLQRVSQEILEMSSPCTKEEEEVDERVTVKKTVLDKKILCACCWSTSLCQVYHYSLIT